MNNDIEINAGMDLGKMSPLELSEEIMEENIDEKAVSKAQHGLMGAAYAYKKGETKNVSPKIKKIANNMSKKDLKDFAGTKEKGLPNHVDESLLRNIIRDTLTKLYEDINLPSDDIPNEDIYTMEDWRRDRTLKVKEGQLIDPDVYFQLLESVPPASTGRIFQPGEAYDHDWKTGQALYQTFKNEGNNYYRYIGLQPIAKYGLQNTDKPLYRAIKESINPKVINVLKESINEISDDTVDNAYIQAMRKSNLYGYDNPERGRWITQPLDEVINESVQTALVKVLGKYTQGKATAEQANKTIMDLANSSNLKRKINESLEDEMRIWQERDKSPFGRLLKQIEIIAKDNLIDAGDDISNIRSEYALDGNNRKTAHYVIKCLENYDFILTDENDNIDVENSNSPEIADLVIKLNKLANNL